MLIPKVAAAQHLTIKKEEAMITVIISLFIQL